VVDKHYNAVGAIVQGRQVSYEVDADTLPMAFGDRMQLQMAHGFANPVIGWMVQVIAHNITLSIMP
jgi:hypothetical protein